MPAACLTMPTSSEPLFAGLVWFPFEAKYAATSAIYEPREYLETWTDRDRGMSKWHDIVDWVGGYPFEVAKPEEVFDFLRARGFQLERLLTLAGGYGCNQYVFSRPRPAGDASRPITPPGP